MNNLLGILTEVKISGRPAEFDNADDDLCEILYNSMRGMFICLLNKETMFVYENEDRFEKEFLALLTAKKLKPVP